MKLYYILIVSMISVNAFAQRFNDAERRLITSGDTTKLLRIIPLSEPEGYKVLKSVSMDVDYSDPLLPLLKERMYKAVTDTSAGGVGIAAPQVGINRNLIWVQRFDKEEAPFEFFINPRIVWRSSLLRRGTEGDLSFSDKRGDVVRSYTIMVTYTGMDGKQHIELLEDFTAVIFQHETDHLFGTLLTDRLEEQKDKIYKEYQSQRPSQLLLEERDSTP